MTPNPLPVEPVEQPKIILMRENFLQSWLRDSFTILMLAGLPWFNYEYCGGSGWINAAIAFAWFVSILARASGDRRKAEMTPAEAKTWLADRYPDVGA